MTVHTGDCLPLLRELPEDSVDSVATDPPYGLAFMARDWDKALPDPAVWAELLRVAKPGAHLAAFGAPRINHRLVCQIEDAGWTIRDGLMWLYGSGFPKSLDVSKAIEARALTGGSSPRDVANARALTGQERAADGEEHAFRVGATKQGVYRNRPGAPWSPTAPQAQAWSGWGTALKPAWEPIVLARAPFASSVAANVLEHGTGALNVDGCRIGWQSAGDKQAGRPASFPKAHEGFGGDAFKIADRSHRDPAGEQSSAGRWPANLLLGCACETEHEPGCAVAMLDEQSGESRSTGGLTPGVGSKHTAYNYDGTGVRLGTNAGGLGDTGGASRFFYTSKASREEREAGLNGERTNVNDGRATSIDNPYQRGDTQRLNLHPTVKPLDLMRWLVRLITPPGGLVLDPFTGSGTTGAACALEGFRFLGMELDETHAETARERIAHWAAVAKKAARQQTMFDDPPKRSPLLADLDARQTPLMWNEPVDGAD